MYTETDRHIFGPYFDGQQARYADPLAVQRKLKATLGGDPNLLLEQYNSPSPEVALPAADQLFRAIAYAFAVHPFDPLTGQGLGEGELIALWNGFQDWCKKKATNTPNSPTSSPSSAGSGPLPLRPTIPTVGSSSTSAASGSGKPGPVPMGRPLPRGIGI